jgi:hypothetical protein
MFKSLGNLSAIISDLCVVRRSTKKRAVTRKNFFAAIEDLEFRQLMSAANTSSDDAFTPRIINGTPVTTGFDAVAQLSFTQTGSATPLKMTGTFITADWVLTSASASKGLTEAGGTGTVTVDGTTYAVDDIVPYSKYAVGAGDFTQDIALWHIAPTVLQTLPSITPIDISRTPAAAKATVTLVGYGLTGTPTTGATGTYGVLNSGTTSIDRVTPSQLTWKLTGTESTSAAGDTGGPVLVQNSTTHLYTIVGVDSTHSTTTSKKNDSAFNTRVDVYAGWIDNITSTAHPTSTVVDDYIDTLDVNGGATNTTFTLTNKVTTLSVTGKIGTFGDIDAFKFVTPSDGVATFDLQNTSPSSILFDPTLNVYDSTGALISTVTSSGTTLSQNDDTSRTNLNSHLVLTLPAGTYYVTAAAYADAELGSYHLTMKEKYSTSSTPTGPVSPTDVTAVGQITYTPVTGAAIYSTGTLVGDQWVMTSASASKGLTTGTGTFIIGGVTYTADEIHVYPKYNAASSGDYRQDIALWHLTAAVNSSIVPLAISTTPAAAGSTVTLAGFGSTAVGSSGLVLGALQTENRKVDRISPAQLVWKLNTSLELTTAAGDTGGAVLQSVGGVYQVVGIASTNVTTASKVGDTALNTRADVYIGWIDDVLSRTHAVLSTSDDNANQPDVISGVNKTSTLTVLKPTVQVTGNLENYGDVDVFKVVVAANGVVDLAVASLSPGTVLLDTNLTLIAADGTTVLATATDINPTADLGSEINTYLTAGTYYVAVSGYANEAVGSYRLTLTANYDTGADTALTAKSLTPNSIGTVAAADYINTPTDVDFFKFVANKTGKFEFDFTNTNPSALDPVIEVFAADGTTSLGSNDNLSSTNHDARVTLTTITSGTTYYVKLSSAGESTGLGQLTVKKVL